MDTITKSVLFLLGHVARHGDNDAHPKATALIDEIKAELPLEPEPVIEAEPVPDVAPE